MSKFLFLFLSSIFLIVNVFSQAPKETTRFAERIKAGRTQAAYGMLTRETKRKFSRIKMEATLSGFKKQLGPLHELKYQRTEVREGNLISFYLMTFEKTGLQLQVTQNENNKIAGFFFMFLKYSLAPYAQNIRHGKELITIKNGHFQLPGEIILPLATEKVPLVIFVHGSGAHDLDETIGPNKVFYDLALGLVTKNIATLRYDKRNLIYDSIFKTDQFTLYEETIEDAMAAVNLARQNPRIDTNRIFVLGHSLGAMAAPYIGRYSGASGIIMMAGPYRMLEDILPDQGLYMAELDGKISRKERRQLKKIGKLRDKIANREFDSTTSAKEMMQYWPARFWLTQRQYAPVTNLPGLNKRVLILQGGRDFQVSSEKDFGPLKAICDSSADCQSILYPALNHLFMPGIGKSTILEYFNPNHIPIEVIEDIADFVIGREFIKH
jgi:pimeloyl-ACP methyl ester carboxylesterase